MIDLFYKIANALQFLRLPIIILGVTCLAVMTTTIFGSKSHTDNYYMIPSAVGLLWSIATYSFIINFNSVPQRADPSWGVFRRMKRHLVRAGYMLLGIVFVVLTIGIVFVSFRMLSIWLTDFNG